MTELWGERIARIIALEEKLIEIDGLAERLAVYLAEPELRGRFMQDAAKLTNAPVGNLVDAFYALIPLDCEVSCHELGFKVQFAD